MMVMICVCPDMGAYVRVCVRACVSVVRGYRHVVVCEGKCILWSTNSCVHTFVVIVHTSLGWWLFYMTIIME